MRAPIPSVVAMAVVCPPGLALAQWTFESDTSYEPCEMPFTWDFAPLDAEADGRLVDGTCDAFDGCMLLFVDDQPFPRTSYTPAFDGRGFETDEEPVSGVNVKRSIHVPPTGMPYARFVDSFVNPTGAPVDVTVRYRCNLGSDGEETGYGADGDAVPETTDTWLATDDADGEGDPSLAFVVQGPGASVGLGRWVSTPGSGSVDFEFDLTLAAGLGREALMIFVVQAPDRVSSYETATWLESMPDEAIAFLGDDDLEDIDNFVAGGVPSLSMGGPYFAPEGGTVDLVATAFDSDGGDLEVAWDLDGDGAYETPGDHAVFDATGKDGPAAPYDVGVRASDGVYTTERRGVVEVVNVPPALSFPPDPDAVVGFEWARPLTVVDPSPDDDVFYDLDFGPPGMTLDDGGVLRWTPTEPREDMIRVALSDHEEGGDRMETFLVSARIDGAPGTPRLVAPDDGETVGVTQPTFTFGSVSDPDGDPVRYTVAVSLAAGQDGCDDAAETIESEPLPAEPSGNTSWTPEDDRLCRGRSYTWGVSASDGFLVSDVEERSFTVDPNAVDDPSGGGDPAAGCACDGVPGTTGPGIATAAILTLSLAASRRARRLGTRTHGRRT